jgi:Haem-NO-binding
MYGMVNMAVRSLIVDRFGESVWQDIRRKAGVEVDEFVAMNTYPDAVTYSVVGAASETLDIPADQLLFAFGEYWVTYTAAEGYGEIMDFFGRDFRTCLKNLNGLHTHMGSVMPHLNPPRFTVEETGPDTLRVHYHSTRKGLGPMVTGLLSGLAKKHNVKVAIEHIPAGTRSDHDEFELHLSA